MNNRLRYIPILFLVAMLPTLAMRDFSAANELRYLSIADEAIAEGHIFTFTNQGEPYADKPPLYLWIVMLGKILFGHHSMLFLSLFSAIPAVAVTLIMDRFVEPYLGKDDRLRAGLVLMTCGLFTGMAIFLRMDMLMTMFITLSLYFFWKMYRGEYTWRNRILFPLSVFFAIFSKGPVGFLMPLVCPIVFLAARHRLKDLKLYWGWVTWGILALLCGIWFTAVWAEGGPEYIGNLLFHQTFDRAVDSFHHKEPFWYYMIVVWYSMAPWSLLIIGTIILTYLKKIRTTELEKFFLSVIFGTFVMLSLFSSKIAVYLTPIFPFCVYFSVSVMDRMPKDKWFKSLVGIPAAILVLTPAGIAVISAIPELHPIANGFCIAASIILSLSGMASIALLCKDRFGKATDMLASGILAAVFAVGLSMPRINDFFGYTSLCKDAKEVAERTGLNNYYTWKVYRPESMDVYLGKDVGIFPADEPLTEEYCDGVLIVNAGKLEDYPEMAELISGKPQHVSGKYLIVELH